MANLEMSNIALGLSFILLLIPLSLGLVFKLGLNRAMLWAAGRMSVQLFLVGFFLNYLFSYNNGWINLLWLMIMITTAVVSAIKNSELSIAKIIWPTFGSFTAATLLVVLFINWAVLRLEHLMDARYLIVLGGMILGNSLRSNIVGLAAFYQSIKKDEKHYLYLLGLGATPMEARLPYLRESMALAVKPTIATMATMGIVALPGMMTGVILGGVDPTVAIRYQIMIMLAILSSTFLSILGTILLTLKTGFMANGCLKNDLFIS